MPRVLEGNLTTPAGALAIVVSRYNESVTNRLLEGALATLAENHVPDDRIVVAWVPGAWEIPLAAQQMASSGRYAAVICLGAVIRGETTHDEHINRAVSLLAEKAANRIRRGATVIKDLGEHPELKGAVQVLSGRYGPYVKHGKINATLPKDRNPEEVTIADAVELIAARAAKGPAKKPARKASKPKKTKKEKEAVEETAH